LGFFASEQAKLTAKNILTLLKKPKATLKVYKSKAAGGMVTLGRKKGAVQIPFGHPHGMIALKQKDLLASMYLK
jgi:NADH dehydrogenase FAD-containing subunit